MVTQPIDEKPNGAGAVKGSAGEGAAQSSQQQGAQSSNISSTNDNDRKICLAPSIPGEVKNQPQRIELNATQLAQLEWQYQQGLRENQQALQQHQQQYEFLSMQLMALAQQQVLLGCDQPQPRRQPRGPHPFQWPQPAVASEVATSVATRALGGNMPGPAAGGAVRDVTGAPPTGFIPAAGLGRDGEEGRGNLADPAPRAPDVRREAQGWIRMVIQGMAVLLVFGIDAEGWMLVLLALGSVVSILFRTGLLEAMLGGGQEGGGLWKTLCSAATVIAEGGGLLTDARYVFSALVCSLFPK